VPAHGRAGWEVIAMMGLLLVWVIVGALGGWLGGLVFRGSGTSQALDIVVGVVGGIFGGFVASLFDGAASNGITWRDVAIVFICGVLLLIIIRFFMRARNTMQL
jgi:uncharacterized membrane protein YeaQ/YmgE (transglycosylase-associated protein family)